MFPTPVKCKEIKMFDNSMTWIFIAIAVVATAGVICKNHEMIEREKTKQVEIQLNIELVKAGITNFPANKY